MKNSIILILLAFAIAGTANAQFLSFGPRVGVSSAWLQVDEKIMHDGEEITYESEGARLGFHIGVYSRVSLGPLYVQPEALFTSAGGKVSVNSDSKGEDIRDLTYNKLDVPIMAGLELGLLRIQAGPVFSLLLSDGARNVDVFDEVEQRYNNAFIGYQAGIGLDISRLAIDLKYEGSLNKLGNNVRIGTETFETDLRTSLVVLAVGINIL